LTLLATNAPLRKMHRSQRVDLLCYVLLERDPATREAGMIRCCSCTAAAAVVVVD
jgi:hypothetical protein